METTGKLRVTPVEEAGTQGWQAAGREAKSPESRLGAGGNSAWAWAAGDGGKARTGFHPGVLFSQMQGEGDAYSGVQGKVTS